MRWTLPLAFPPPEGSTSSMPALLGPLLLQSLDSDVREGDIASVRLQTDEARVGIDTWRIPAARVGRGTLKASRLLPVETDNVVLTIHFDFVAVPALRCEILSVLVVLLPGAGSSRLDLVNGARPGKEAAVRLAEALVAPCFFVDLDFIAGMYRDKGGVVGGIDWIRRRVRQARIAEAHEHARVVVVGAAGMRQREVQSQNEVLETLRRVEQQPNTSCVLLRDQHPAKAREAAAAGHLPVRKLRVGSVEQVGKSRIRDLPTCTTEPTRNLRTGRWPAAAASRALAGC